MSYDTMKPSAIAASPIMERFDDLAKILEELRVSVNTLGERIDPFMMPDSPIVSKDETEKVTQQSRVHQTIEDQIKTVAYINGRVVNFLSRLQI